MRTLTWFSGANNYRKHTHILNDGEYHTYDTELLDVETRPIPNISAIFADDLRVRQNKVVEVLYSGGLDSECVLRSCIVEKIPVRAITMRLLAKGYAINTPDLYYSEKFCRENSIEQIIIDLHVDKFFERGDHVDYLSPYMVTAPHVATHFWLFEQCTGFPVMGGEYSWPWTSSPILSPHRHLYSYYDKFLSDRSIPGIGNMLSHSIDANLMFIQNNLAIRKANNMLCDAANIPFFKKELLTKLGFADCEMRMKYYGWEGLPNSIVPVVKYTNELLIKYNRTISTITWNTKIAEVLGGLPGTNDKY